MPTPTDFKNILRDSIHRGKSKDKLEDIGAYLLIQDLITFPEYFPTTSSSLRFHTLAAVLNDIIIYKRQNIIEFGAGISTLAIANLIKKNHLNCNFYSVEDNSDWLNIIKSYLTKNNLREHVNLIYAPLEKTNLALENNSWYSINSLSEKLNKDLKINLAMIDGPGAWRPEIRSSRYPAVPYLLNFLDDNFSIYLDDINRKGEKKILNLWQKKYSMKFEKINNTAALYIKGKKLNTIP
jgi:hypothetical protein